MATDTETVTDDKSVTEIAADLRQRDDLSQEEKVAKLEKITAGMTHETNGIGEADLIQALHDLADEHGEPLTASKIREHGRYALQTYVNHFDKSMANVVEDYGHESGK